MNQSVKFGTDGIRGNADEFPFTNKALIYLGQAIAKWSINKYKKIPKVLIGHDTRISYKRIKNELEKGLLHFNLNIVDAQTIPTPAICKLITHYKEFDFGIIISASHNPYYDNGIKLVDAKTGKLNIQDELKIEENFKEFFIKKEKIKNQLNIIDVWKNAGKEYAKLIFSILSDNFLKDIKIILDCANGATYKVAPSIFEKLGAKVITINNSPNGTNINKNCGALHTGQLETEILKHKANIGFAFDGDGDRVIAVNKNGKTINGDQIIALLSQHPKAKNYDTVVGTIMTNLGLDLHLNNKNIKLIRTKVGDKNVSSKLKEKKLFLGGETSGHIIMTDYLNTGDGIFTALRIAQVAILENNWTLESFKQTPQVLINMPIKQKKDLTQKQYAKIIENHKKLLIKGRIVVRYSGTENILRVMVEGIKEKNATNVANLLVQNLQKALEI